ncbi:hypothetical protein HDU83_003903 [Entophlyctis luteolus]|nr:hypothetical protein HDU83_003903 [Entophlyctis luteolus]
MIPSAMVYSSLIAAFATIVCASHLDLQPVLSLAVNNVPIATYVADASISAAAMDASTLAVSFTVASASFVASRLGSVAVADIFDSPQLSVVHPAGYTFDAAVPDVHYAGMLDDGTASVKATLYDNGVHLLVFNSSSGSVFQVDPVAHLAGILTQDELAAIGGASHVAYVPSTSGLDEQIAPNSTASDVSLRDLAVPRRDAIDVEIPSVGYAPLFSGCFPNMLLNHTARLAFYVTYGMFLQLDGPTATYPYRTLAKLGQIVTDMNIVYEHQLRITVQVHTGRTKIMMSPNTTNANYKWNYGPGYCSVYNTDALSALQQYVASQPVDNTVTTNFLLTVCPDASGYVGHAYLPGACSSWNTGSVIYNTALWLTVAHEFGHNLNASHAFEQGQGKTGGIMDYADGRYPIGTGYYGFHPIYNYPEICPFLSIIEGT